jgi:hypothetical protein
LVIGTETYFFEKNDKIDKSMESLSRKYRKRKQSKIWKTI